MQIEGDPRPSNSVDNIVLDLKILHILLFWVLLYFFHSVLVRNSAISSSDSRECHFLSKFTRE